MRKTFLALPALAGLLLGIGTSAHAQDTLAYWNFNNSLDSGTGAWGSAWAFPLAADDGTGSLNGGNWTAGDIGAFTGNAANAQGGDPAGTDLALRDQANNGNYIEFTTSTTDY